MYRALLLITFFASPAFALGPRRTVSDVRPSGPELKIEVANITRVDGTRAELGLGLFTRGERGRHAVEVWFVEGNQRHKLWDNQSIFAPTRGGFRSTATVDLRGRNLSRGQLQIVAPACVGNGCRKTIPLGTGANLAFTGVDEIQRVGSNSNLRLQVTNTGSGPSAACQLQVDVDGRRASSFAVASIAPGQRRDFQFRYANRQQGSRYEAKLLCRDLVGYDNDKDGQLR